MGAYSKGALNRSIMIYVALNFVYTSSLQGGPVDVLLSYIVTNFVFHFPDCVRTDDFSLRLENLNSLREVNLEFYSSTLSILATVRFLNMLSYKGI